MTITVIITWLADTLGLDAISVVDQATTSKIVQPVSLIGIAFLLLFCVKTCACLISKQNNIITSWLRFVTWRVFMSYVCISFALLSVVGVRLFGFFITDFPPQRIIDTREFFLFHLFEILFLWSMTGIFLSIKVK
jgi:hypothetical protein